MTQVLMQRGALILAFLAAVLAVSLGVYRYAYFQALEQTTAQGRADLALASDRLVGQLQRFRELAVLLADHPVLAQSVVDAGQAQALFLSVADKIDALDIFYLNQDGRVVAAARAAPGANLGALPFVRRAAQGALGWGHRAQSPLAARAYYYAAPVFAPDGRVQGSVVVAVDLSDLEDDWRGDERAVFFTDQAGVVFVSNRSELVQWQRRADGPGLAPPTGPAPAFASDYIGPHEVWRLGWGPYFPENALHLVQDLPIIGLRGEILFDVAPARRLAGFQAIALAGLCLAFGALLFLATERRRTLAIANTLLESRVARRTAALLETNEMLRREAREREDAQMKLAQAQADLVQASKLSALGQMSAGISHELNQPLMAIRSFAENAVQFQQRGQEDRVKDNLGRISDMARRMGRIISNLRAFSRQETEAQGRVNLTAILNSTIELLQSRINDCDATLIFDTGPAPVWVQGGEVRLGQVFVNLVSNALDAMEGRAHRVLRITVSQGERVQVDIDDTGGGIAAPEKVFDPFYSTKNVGAAMGMGLGLSISYGIVQSLGGDIRGQNTQDGARFSVFLKPMPQEEPAP